MPDQFILDTGPLMEFLVRRYEQQFGPPWPDPRFNFHALRSPIDTVACERFFAASRNQLRTTPGVVVEIRYHLRCAERSGTISPHRVLRSRFWQLAQDEFRQLGMDEHLIRLLDVRQEILIDAGPVDAGLLELARRFLQQGDSVVVLTDDDNFRKQCGREQVTAEGLAGRLASFRP